ncbi:MAG: zinc metallopeptidase, partial [Mucinivorans sp.]
NSNSVAAAAVAAHECGHAVQHAVGYAPLKMRSALVPVTSFSAKYAFLFLIGGILIMQSSSLPQMAWIFWVGIAMLAASALFSLITLPVEYNASHRALAWLSGQHILSSQQQGQAREALTWAARTYLVAAISAVTTLLYYLGFARRD